MKKKNEEKKPRSRYRLRRGIGVPADVAGDELERIASEHDGLTARVLVDESAPKDAPLHPAFEWNNAKAGDLYRLDQARNIIRAVHVVEDDGSDGGSAFYHVASVSDGADDPKYLPEARVIADPDLYASAVQTLAANLQAAQRGLAALERRAKVGAKSKRIKAAGRHVGNAVQELKKAV